MAALSLRPENQILGPSIYWWLLESRVFSSSRGAHDAHSNIPLPARLILRRPWKVISLCLERSFPCARLSAGCFPHSQCPWETSGSTLWGVLAEERNTPSPQNTKLCPEEASGLKRRNQLPWGVTVTRQVRTSDDLTAPCLELDSSAFWAPPGSSRNSWDFFLIFIPVRFFSFPHTYWRILRSYSCFLFYLLFSFIHSPNSAYTIFFQFWKISGTLTLAWWICFQMLICLYCLFAFLHLSNSVFEHCYH